MEITIEDYKTLTRVKDRLSTNYYLEPEPYDAKSFYKKATVYEGNGIKVLVSYTTPVVLLVNGMVFKLQNDDEHTTLSRTTMRHINAFLRREGVGKTCKKEWKQVMVG